MKYRVPDFVIVFLDSQEKHMVFRRYADDVLCDVLVRAVSLVLELLERIRRQRRDADVSSELLTWISGLPYWKIIIIRKVLGEFKTPKENRTSKPQNW